MFRSLQIEWMKIKNYRVFQVFSALYLMGIIGSIYIVYKIYISMIAELTKKVTGAQSEGSDIFGLFSSENIWYTTCFATSFLLYLPGMIIISLFTNEVNFKTHRQNIIDGWKRETFIYSKIALIGCIAFVITLMNLLAVFIMCRITETDFSFSSLPVLGLSFIQSFIYLMFALMLATFLRRSGVAIIVFFIYGLILEPFLFWLLGKLNPAMGHFLPLQVSDSLINKATWGAPLFQNMPELKFLLIGAFAYAGLYIFLAVRKYKYDDL